MMGETKMDKLTTEFAEHICDNLCQYPNILNEEELEDKCLECKMGAFICDILNEYNRVNDFDQTETAKIMKKVQELKDRYTAKRVDDSSACMEKTHYKCPKCGDIKLTMYTDGNRLGNTPKYCNKCGQRLDWSGVE